MLARGLSLVLMIAAIFVASRLVVRALPGDPLETLVAESGTSIPRERLRADLGLDRPFLPALAHDAARALRGDLGVSLLTRKPVAPVLARRFGRTLALTTLAFTLGLALALALGLAAAARPGELAHRVTELHGALASALPTAWIGPMLLVVLAVRVPIFPVGASVWLPAITLALSYSGFWSRLIRTRVAETLAAGSAPGARARGLSELNVLVRHGLAPAAGSIAAYLGTQFGGLLAGAFVAEAVFDWPGLGTLLVEAVQRRDYPVVEAAVFVGAAASLLGTLGGDLAQRLLDPRVAKSWSRARRAGA